jgi:hypothetical protein
VWLKRPGRIVTSLRMTKATITLPHNLHDLDEDKFTFYTSLESLFFSLLNGILVLSQSNVTRQQI